jgi:hypothetical protein
MYEKEIQFITDYNLNKINNLGPTFTIDKLVDLELHPAIIRYISGELDYLIYLDRKALLENSTFDYSGMKINEYFSQISMELKRTIKLSFEQVKKLIEKAVAFNSNFTIHPVGTLTGLIFKNSNESKNVSEIKVYLNYIYYYDYLRDVLNSYFFKKKLVSLKKQDFEAVMKKINNELLSQKEEIIISDTVDSIADFYNDGAVNKSLVSVGFVETYLKSENLDEQNSRLNKVYKNSKKKVDVDELKAALFSVAAKSAEQETEIDESPSEIKSEEKVLDFSEKSSDKNKEKRKSVNEEENLADEIEEMNADEEIPQEDETDELIEEVPSFDKSKFKKDLFSFLSKKETEKIIGTIFNDDREDFTTTMEKLEECGDYNSASEILKKIFSTYKINPYHKEAVALTDAVFDYFRQAN